MEPFASHAGLRRWKTWEQAAPFYGFMGIGRELVEILRIRNANSIVNECKRERRKSKCLEP